MARPKLCAALNIERELECSEPLRWRSQCLQSRDRLFITIVRGSVGQIVLEKPTPVCRHSALEHRETLMVFPSLPSPTKIRLQVWNLWLSCTKSSGQDPLQSNASDLGYLRSRQPPGLETPDGMIIAPRPAQGTLGSTSNVVKRASGYILRIQQK